MQAPVPNPYDISVDTRQGDRASNARLEEGRSCADGDTVETRRATCRTDGTGYTPRVSRGPRTAIILCTRYCSVQCIHCIIPGSRQSAIHVCVEHSR